MSEREIGDGSVWQRIKCEHCAGTGKCDCRACDTDGDDVKVRCTICDGFGFLLIDANGNVKVPKKVK